MKASNLDKIRKKVAEPRNHVVPPIRLTAREYEYVQNRAKEEGVTLSEYVRACILSEDFF